MKKEMTENIIELVSELEYLIGSECYNPNSYDGYKDIEGCAFRYPVMIPSKDGKFQKIRRNIQKTGLISKADLTCDALTYMKYRFGSNELFVGKGLLNILGFLEDRYNLNFEELEIERKIKK